MSKQHTSISPLDMANGEYVRFPSPVLFLTVSLCLMLFVLKLTYNSSAKLV